MSRACFLSAEFGMNEDLRKMEVGGVSSRDLYVKRELINQLSCHPRVHPIKYLVHSYSIGSSNVYTLVFSCLYVG